MPETVRKQILDVIIERVSALPWFGKMIEAVTDDEQGGEDASDVTPKMAAGRVVVELVSFDSVPDEGSSAFDIVAWTMDVVLIMHLPTVLPNDQGGQPLLPSQYADQLCADVYQVFQPDADPDSVFGGLAMRADPGPFGGVGFSDRGTRATAMAWNIAYRHSRNDPGVPR